MPHRFPFLIAAAIALLSTVQPAHADIHRCVDAAGKVEYSDAPCGNGTQAGVVSTRANVLDASQGREQTLRAENRALRERLATQLAPVAANPPPPSAEPARIDSVACQIARRDYEVSASSISNTKELVRAKESAMYGLCGLKEPARSTTHVVVKTDETPRYLALPQPKVSAPRVSP